MCIRDRAQIPFNTTSETWADGQTFEVCIDGNCGLYDDPADSAAVAVSFPGDGVYQLTMTPVGTDGVREPVSASVSLNIGQ